MKRAETIKKVLTEFNRENIRYCALRNYEFLLNPKEEPGFDFDVSIAAEDHEQAERIFLKYGFIKKPPQFSQKHQGYAAFSQEELRKIGFDVQWDGVAWNDRYYLERAIYDRCKKGGGFFVLSDEDEFIMYLCHSLLGKRFFKPEYRLKLQQLAAKELDFAFIAKHLSAVFRGERIGQRLVALVKEGRFDDLLTMKQQLLWRFVVPQHLMPFIRLFFRWFKEKGRARKLPLIAFIGPDGAGKSTTTAALVRILRENRRSVEQAYLGRGKGHMLPIDKPGKVVYKRIRRLQPSPVVRLVYTLASFIYAADLLLRYSFVVRRRRKRAIVITDRYATDIYLMRNVSESLRLFLFSLFPRPTLTFYLYHEPQRLYARKRQQSIEELRWQLALYDKVAARLGAVRIKTENKKRVVQEAATETFELLARSGE